MTPQELKNSILQMAIQGKLVEQRPEEGTAEELYQQIQKEKAALVKQGKIKKEKPLPEIAEDEKPFDIPNTWCWVRLEQITSLISDGTHQTPHYIENGVPFVSVKDISTGFLDFSQVKYISETEHRELTARCRPEKNDVLICRIGTLGKALTIDTDKEFSIFVSLGLIKLIEKNIAKYIETTINSGYGFSWIQRVKVGGGTHTYKINLEDLRLLPIPLPPLAEQKRILAKIEEMLPLIDRYEDAWTKLEDFNKRFPGDLQKSLLQMAIQGKLVEQRPEEGTGEELYQQIQKEKAALIKQGKIKKEKPLPEIAEDEKPFDIPDSWMWVRFADIFEIGSAIRIHQSDWKTEGIPFLRGRELVRLAKTGEPNAEIFITEELYEQNKEKGGVPEKGDLLVTAVGTLGKVYVVKGTHPFYYKDAYILRYMNYANLDPQYFRLMIESPFCQEIIHAGSMGTTVAQLTIQKAKNMCCVLPPLAEQKRIVAKLEELLPLCDKLKKN